MRLFAAASACASGSASNARTAASRAGSDDERSDARREQRLDLVRRAALLAQVAAQAVEDERRERRRGWATKFATPSNAANASAISVAQRQVDALLDQDADHAERRAAQPERILVAGRHLADAEQSRERLELVRERHGLRDAAFGQRVAGEARPVVLRDRIGDVGRLAVVLRVVAAHRALQLGKLADHVGGQVGLREQRRAIGGSGVGADATARSRARAAAAGRRGRSAGRARRASLR